MANEIIGDIVISPRVLEVITGIATTKVDGVHSLHNKTVADSLSKVAHGRGVYLQTEEDGTVNADIYVYLQYGVNVPAVSIAIQQAVKTAVYDMAEVSLSAVNIHVVGIVPEKTPKPDMKTLFDEDFLDG
ncbi:Asp23/Gls24 family envelope stress response protein [Streptococcus orisasini]|uniref:Asp23/Gls24 family envelope stress response protein n=1 Tax=Streptococcus orisasini TaxID=1080071 RepID=UPI00070FD164|nr:Asp23/Gls24 family envelope stress response protein [Streptococcus orisasini]